MINDKEFYAIDEYSQCAKKYLIKEIDSNKYKFICITIFLKKRKTM